MERVGGWLTAGAADPRRPPCCGWPPLGSAALPFDGGDEGPVMTYPPPQSITESNLPRKHEPAWASAAYAEVRIDPHTIRATISLNTG
jgi:hypothetical protein